MDFHIRTIHNSIGHDYESKQNELEFHGTSLCIVFSADGIKSQFHLCDIYSGIHFQDFYHYFSHVRHNGNSGIYHKTDLTKLGSFLLMALIGIIIATLINMFTRSSQLDFIISIIGVIIFTGLTAYDVQKIKRIGESGMLEGDMMAKITIHAALSLYLDFINLFLYLLRFFGNSRD